ncbi:MAG: AAA family ATPase [Geminicoccaceae bacterium]
MSAAPATAADLNANDERETFLAFVTDAESQQVIDQVVSDLMIPHASIRKANVHEAINYLGEHRSPKLLVVDISGSDLPLSDVEALADVCEPGVTVIAVGERNDVGLFRDLIKHGIADYLVKPISPTLLNRAILNSAEQTNENRQTSKLGKLVGVVGTRGGVGATTVATNLAWLMANERRRRVALLDLDLQLGSVALSLDLEPSQGLREALENPSRIDGLFVDRIMVQHSERLFVMSAEEALDEPTYPDEAALDLLLNELRSKFHYVVVDVPRQPGPCFQHVLQAATHLIVVSDLSLVGMRDALRLNSYLPVTNAACQVTVVANRQGEHKGGEMPLAEFEKGIGRKIDYALPFDGKHCAAATNVGQLVASGSSPTIAGLKAIAEQVAGSRNPRKASFWSRWLKG